MATTAEDMKKQLEEQQAGNTARANQQQVDAAKPQGIISSAQNYKAPETKPVTTEVNAGQETVESRLNALTATGSNYTNLAKQDAMRSANSRGLINSSMAAGAGTEAAIRSALPIAQQDAKTYTDTRFLNQNTENDFLKNRQSADLNMETAAQASNLQRGEAKWQNELDMTRDTNSTDLNKSLEILQSSLRMDEEEFSTNLKTQAEQILSDAKFSDEIKLQYVNSINTIVRDTQQQITDIGLSDRSAEQQATAIRLATENRDAQLAVYQDLLTSFPDWQWSADFTQGVQGQVQPGGSQAQLEESRLANASQQPAAPPVPQNAVRLPNGSYAFNGVLYDASGNIKTASTINEAMALESSRQQQVTSNGQW